MQYTKILVPLDGSPLSESILPYAESFAERLNIPMELLHVIDLDAIRTYFDAQQGRPIDEVEKEMKARATEYLQKVAASLPNTLTIRHTVVLGSAPTMILAQAEEEKGTLLAMATRGYSGAKRWFFGSVADKILHGAQTPLLLFKGSPEGDPGRKATIKRVLVPLDGSGLAEQILPHVTTLGKAMNLEVELLRIYSVPVTVAAPASAAYPIGMPMLTLDTFREEATEYLDGKVQQLREGEGLREISYSVTEGEAADRIIETAHQTRDSLIAMSTHGRSGLGRWILGSVADRVIRQSGDPVFVIRPTAGA
ncbi:MAG TPA: universal stress protein [Candidatus Binatia bacterium]|nr:universal stress protein [Candidatus Binatia bacterium]